MYCERDKIIYMKPTKEIKLTNPKKALSLYDRIFKTLLDERGIKYEMEYYFHRAHAIENNLDVITARDFHFDFCIIDKKIAFELEGGIYSQGRHVRPLGFITDCIKYNLALSIGWKPYRFPTNWFIEKDLSYITTILDGIL